jgi:hypothetical protein
MAPIKEPVASDAEQVTVPARQTCATNAAIEEQV